ncbi:endo-1,4-beta-xylanase [Maribellus sp. YY47]|uniref:endo-1,4-beta-xylanase n=1 Tax=Maribellus sp. YY47 TaxID=2929486 RepID=UPI0020007756|nr:endo-1,4-beta-xylanase [Maribellus sp. YY47]MCK3684694.1 endo-1,4-beta-xylanase [Maribellus sp. YY47]
MRYLNKLWLGAVALLTIVACTDDSLLDYKVNKPESIAGLEYLNDYDVLKSYINRTNDPNFKLGAGVSVDAYNKQGAVYSHITSNFDEMTAGWEMKHGAVVQDNGKLDTGRVKQFIATAKNAGITIYGHTLAWHANQNATYLNSIIADKEIEIDPNDANNALHATTPEAKTNIWDWQLEYVLPTPLTQGVEYTLKMRAKASSPFTVGFWRTNGSSTNYGPDIAFGESWSDASVTFTPTMDATRLQFCFGTFAGDLYFDDMVLTASGSEENLIENGAFDDTNLSGWQKPGWHAYTFAVETLAAGPATWWTNLITNSDVESDDVSSFFATEIRVGPNPATIGADGTGADGVGRAIVVKSGDSPNESWDTQFFVKAPQQLLEGQAYRFSMKVKADKPATIESQSHNNPGGYIHWSMVGSPAVTTEWKEYTNSGIISAQQAGANGMNTIAFNLAVFKEANTYYFDDIVWEIEESGNTIPLTPEEKADTLLWALDNWIAGMMKVSKDYVKAWDVVNEPMDDGNPYEIKTGVGKTDMAADEFYWQDYLGKDYAVVAFKLARQYGNADDKLFINDYNLEYNLDKCKGLIQYVAYLESEGATVDGIGTQMHISTGSDKEKIAQMFELLAATGKLIKISELDIGIGKTTSEATEEDYQAQAEMYKYVVQKYFELIPATQRYGITVWSPLDSPVESSWRAGEPIGLWTEGYDRKPAYAGFADGLSGENN